MKSVEWLSAVQKVFLYSVLPRQLTSHSKHNVLSSPLLSLDILSTDLGTNSGSV